MILDVRTAGVKFGNSSCHCKVLVMNKHVAGKIPWGWYPKINWPLFGRSKRTHKIKTYMNSNNYQTHMCNYEDLILQIDVDLFILEKKIK